MIIVYSSNSCALACVGNEARETLRCRLCADAKTGWFPTDNEDASPNEVNSFRPRYAKMPMANLPEMVKPATYTEEINKSTYKVGRGGWRERASKEQSGYLGRPSRTSSSEVEGDEEHRGNNNPIHSRRRKSERLVVTMTQGNACRVKELYRYYVCRTKRSAA